LSVLSKRFANLNLSGKRKVNTRQLRIPQNSAETGKLARLKMPQSEENCRSCW